MMAELINRQNYEDVQEFLRYQGEVRQLAKGTTLNQWSQLRHLLEWSGPAPLGRCKKQKVHFAVFLEGLTDEGRPFSNSYLTGILKTAKVFMRWCRQTKPRRFHDVDDVFLESWRPSRERREAAEYHEREVFNANEVVRLVKMTPRGLAELRTQAAAALLFVSGMRVGAMVTLPVECVDIENMQIYQLPAKGVHTKNRKAAITFLLNIPELLSCVREWDAVVREKLGEKGYWFAALGPFGDEVVPDGEGSKRDNRRIDFARDLRALCERAEVPYKSPHKLRHGFAVYALKRSKTMGQMKAISQNLMHSTMGITDGIYGRLVRDEQKEIITGL